MKIYIAILIYIFMLVNGLIGAGAVAALFAYKDEINFGKFLFCFNLGIFSQVLGYFLLKII